MSILSKWGFRTGGSVHASHRYHRYLSKNSGNTPEAVANPRTPNGDSTFLGTLRELAAGWQAVKTRWELVEELRIFESRAAREMIRAPATAEVREETIEDYTVFERSVKKWISRLGAKRF